MEQSRFADCVKKMQSGDREGLKIIYEEYVGYIYTVVYGILPSKEDAEDVLSEEFEYACTHTMTSTSSSLWKDSSTSLGTIVREPDANGFFLMRPRYGDEDHLCVLLKKKESPSLYRGMLY